ncbi:Uncharacterized membrane protein, DUF485 family [Saccharopolyspora shandongensis]|uniref:Uncharacterized membrane protein, DUF485 family n=1 Tax=Saccharopolyspora shandongensis TaxID=418495 RepID=A0A1H2S3C4_9PSEU|nr:Uncharacterized membrane protein, DUF485 family [Saccharopolyspora shandongensis]
MSTTDQIGSGSGIDAETWAAAHSSPEFTTLRRRLRNFVFPVSALFLAWYLVYVLLADYAHGFMSIKLVGNINVGLVLGLLQFVSTFAITTWYVRFANRELDPIAEGIRESLEGGASDKVADNSGDEAADTAEDSTDDAPSSDDAPSADEAPEKSADDSAEKETAADDGDDGDGDGAKDDGDAPEKSADDSAEKETAADDGDDGDGDGAKDDGAKKDDSEGGQK